MASLDKEGLAYLWGKLKTILNSKAEKNHTHSENMSKAEVEALIETMVLQGYLDGYRLRVVDDANDGGKTGYITVKKG